MNQPIPSKTFVPYLRLVSSHEQPIERDLARPEREDDAFDSAYRRLDRRLRAACGRYVDAQDVDDLAQEVWIVASQRPAKLAQSDGRLLSWLIGIAKRCTHTYDGRKVRRRRVPLEALLAREAGDDLEGRAMFEDVEERRAERWGDEG